MPERNPTAKPVFMAGTTIQSGTPNTGQVLFTQGGTKSFQKLSGTAGGDAAIHVGGGRLDYVVIHPPATPATAPAASGQGALAFAFYDSATAVSGGPLATSGHVTLLKALPIDPYIQTQLIFDSGLGQIGRLLGPLGFPFSSGLCFASRSGQCGFTAYYTPVVSG